MNSVTFVIALALAIAFTSFRSTAAAPAVASSFCETECKEGQLCDENSVYPSCTPCLDCSAFNRATRLDNCAKSETECGECLAGFMEIENECTVNGTEGMESDFQIPDIPTGPKKGPKTPSVGYFTIILVTLGILAVIVLTLVCVAGRRPCLSTQGGPGAKIRRLGEEASVQFQRDVHEENELDRLGQPYSNDGDVEFHDQNDHQPVENDGDAEVERLIQDALYPPPVEPAEVQKPHDPNQLGDEDSVSLGPHKAVALITDDISPEMENDDRLDVDNNVHAAAIPEENEDQEQNAGVESLPDSGTHSEDENDRVGDERGRAGDENRVHNRSRSGNESGIGDDEATAHHVPQSPLSPATQTPQLAGINPIASSSNSYAHRLQNLNVNPTEIAEREEEQRLLDNKSLPHYIEIRRHE